MTKTTEELKRAMYGMIGSIRKLCNAVTVPATSTLDLLEDSIEEYLEALRKDAKAEELRLTETIRYNGVLSDAYSHQQLLTHAACASERDTWAENHDLKARVRELESGNDRGHAASLQDQAELQNLREQRDELRNKLQAFEFANKSAGELLIDSRAKVKAQRQSIGKLKNERDNAKHALKVKDSKLQKALEELSEARKLAGATSVQSVEETAPETICDASTPVIDAEYIDKTLSQFTSSWEKHLDLIEIQTK